MGLIVAFLFLFVCASCLSIIECSQPWSKVSMATTCGGGSHLLCDLDNVLNASEAASLASLLEKDLGSEDQYECAKKIYVVIVKRLTNPYSQEINKKMSEAAEYLRREWRGELCCATAVVLLSTGDGKVSTRFCDEPRMCAGVVEEAYKNNSHYLFDPKQYGTGLEKFIQAYQEEINNPYICVEDHTVGLAIFMLLWCGLTVGVIVMFCCCDEGAGQPVGTHQIGGGANAVGDQSGQESASHHVGRGAVLFGADGDH